MSQTNQNISYDKKGENYTNNISEIQNMDKIKIHVDDCIEDNIVNNCENNVPKVNTFSSLGINPCGKNDYFNVPKIQLEEIVGVEIHLLNFVLNINTIHGNDRCVILIKILETGNIYKVFSSSRYIREVLEMTDKKDLPIATKINKIAINKKATSYMFT